MKTTESNKLIAEFMGVTPTETKYTKYWYDGYELHEAELPFSYGAMGNGTSELKFSTSWDWLMPVVEKINQSGYTLEGVNLVKKISIACGSANLIYAYKAVAEFIKWYNENNNHRNKADNQ